MKIKPYTGAPSLEQMLRSVYEALTGKLTLADNAACSIVTVQWNSDRMVRIPAPARPPISVVVLKANLLSDPSSFVSGGAASWSPQPNGDLLITGLDALTVSVEWSVDLLLVES